MPPAAPDAATQARQLALALDVIEARLDALSHGAQPSEIANALAAPIRAFDTLAKAALKGPAP